MVQGGRGVRSKSGDKKLLVTLLKKIRQDAGLRQTDLAVSLGKPQSYVSKYESGERRLDILELRQVCRAVGISLVEFSRRLEKLVL